jgi:hypothetical protein
MKSQIDVLMEIDLRKIDWLLVLSLYPLEWQGNA